MRHRNPADLPDFAYDVASRVLIGFSWVVHVTLRRKRDELAKKFLNCCQVP